MIDRWFDGGHTSIGGELLKLENIVAGHHAIRRAGKLFIRDCAAIFAAWSASVKVALAI